MNNSVSTVVAALNFRSLVGNSCPRDTFRPYVSAETESIFQANRGPQLTMQAVVTT